MPYNNFWEKNGVYRKYNNYITGTEILQAIEDVHNDIRFDSISYVINDLLNVSKYDISDKDIKTIAVIDSAAALSNENIKVAIVATQTDFEEMYPLYNELASKSSFAHEIFTSLAEARNWVT